MPPTPEEALVESIVAYFKNASEEDTSAMIQELTQHDPELLEELRQALAALSQSV